MGLLERVIRALIYICCIAAIYFLVVWVLTSIGIFVPLTVLHIFGVILGLIAILILIRLFVGTAGPNWRWFP